MLKSGDYKAICTDCGHEFRVDIKNNLFDIEECPRCNGKIEGYMSAMNGSSELKAVIKD